MFFFLKIFHLSPKTVIYWFQPFSLDNMKSFYGLQNRVPALTVIALLSQSRFLRIIYTPETLLIMPHCHNKIDIFGESATLFLSWKTMIYIYSSLPSFIQLIFHFKSNAKAVKSYLQYSFCCNLLLSSPRWV